MGKNKQKIVLLIFCMVAMTCFFRPLQVNASAGSVTAYQKITWGISTGRYYVNGIHAFCAEYNKSWPTVGTTITSIMPCANEVLRKALYYGCNGPANTLGTDERAHVLTAIAVSDANIGESTTGTSSKYDIFYWDIVNNPSKYPSPPSNFKAYLAIPSNNNMQKLAFYVMEENGYVKGVKTSSNPSVTDGNSCYSLEGAEYGVYSGASAEESFRVGTLLTDRDGNTNVLELPPGTYYAKEIKAPQGYKMNAEVISFTVTSGETITLSFADEPQMTQIELILQKVDAQTGLPKPQGTASLQGAQFTVKYYKGTYEQGKNPDKTWVFETDENGAVYMRREYLLSGDSTETFLPLGTITVQETKAPKGYLVNPTVFVQQTWIEAYQYPVVREEKIAPYQLIIQKTDKFKNLLEGAEFILYSDEECKNEVAKGTTDKQGILQFDNLEVQEMYYLKEVKPPTGYEIAKEDALIPVYLLSSPEDNEHHIQVVNEPNIVLPKTGSLSVVMIPAVGLALCSISIYLNQKEKEKKV